MSYYVGVDLSLTCTGIAAIDKNGYLVSTAIIETKPAPGLEARIARYDHISRSVVNFIKAHSPCHVLLEGYSFGSRGRGVFNIAESGGIVRHQIIAQCPDILSITESAPKSMQKAVTGYGGLVGVEKKQAVKDAVEHIFGPLGLKKFDQYDAIGLALVSWWGNHEK